MILWPQGVWLVSIALHFFSHVENLLGFTVLQLSNMQYSVVSCSYHAVHCIAMT